MSENKIDLLAKKNEELSSLKKEVDKLKAEVKSQGVGSYEGNEYKAIVEERVSQKLDPEKTLEVVKKLNAKWLLKEVVNEEALEDSIATGEIDGAEFADCVVEKKTVAVKFVKVKK